MITGANQGSIGSDFAFACQTLRFRKKKIGASRTLSWPRRNLAQSILNPRAGLNDLPAVGLGPTAAVNVMEHYDKSFKGEEKKPAEMKIAY